MKRLTLCILIATALTSVLSCQKNSFDEPKETILRTLHFKAVGENLATKASFGQKESYGYPVLWSSTDKVGITVDCAPDYEAAAVTPSEDRLEGSFSAALPTPEGTSFQLLAAAPRAAIMGFDKTAAAVTLNIPVIQTPEVTGPDPQAMVLVARKTLTEIPTEAILLPFSHVTAYGCMSLTNLPTTDAILSIELVSSVPLSGKWVYSPAGLTLVKDVSAQMITLKTNRTSDIFFACAPYNLKDQTLTVRVNTTDFVYETSATITEDRFFAAGHVSKFTVDMSSAKKIHRRTRIVACWGNSYTNRNAWGNRAYNPCNWPDWLQDLLGDEWYVYNGGYNGGRLHQIVPYEQEWEAENDADLSVFYMERNSNYSDYTDLLNQYETALSYLTNSDDYIILGSHIRQYWPIANTYPERGNLSTDKNGDTYEDVFIAPFKASGKCIDLYHTVIGDWKNWLVRTGKYESVAEIDTATEYPGVQDGRTLAQMADTDGDGVGDLPLDWPMAFWYSVNEGSFVHPSQYGAKAFALMVYDKMMEMGYLEPSGGDGLGNISFVTEDDWGTIN